MGLSVGGGGEGGGGAVGWRGGRWRGGKRMGERCKLPHRGLGLRPRSFHIFRFKPR